MKQFSSACFFHRTFVEGIVTIVGSAGNVKVIFTKRRKHLDSKKEEYKIINYDPMMAKFFFVNLYL